MKPLPIVLSGLLLACLAGPATAAEVTLRLLDPPEDGTLRVELYDSKEAFDSFAPIYRVAEFPLDGRELYRIDNLPAGSYALLVYQDSIANGRLDLNFLGMPKELVGFANNYQPKGTPSYDKARFELYADEIREFGIELRKPFGGKEKKKKDRRELKSGPPGTTPVAGDP